MRDKRISVSLSEEEHTQLEELAYKSRQSLSEWVRKQIKEKYEEQFIVYHCQECSHTLHEMELSFPCCPYCEAKMNYKEGYKNV